ncbi:MAG: DNA internalization-related competence protein ComEC/Rec2 [Gammaproteobacteria bacterium]|nr:DNA internalization-related competence protein ComEC/Rec2 [Gammaproteobacteria bacterium]
MWLLFFIIGILSHQTFIFAWLLLLLFIKDRASAFKYIAILVGGYLCMAWHHVSHYSRDFPIGWQHIQGEIVSFQQNKYEQTQWLISINSSHTQIWVHCKFHCPSMYPGETWAIEGRTWKRTVLNNPGSNNIWYQESFRHISGHMLLSDAKRIHPIPFYNVIAKIRQHLYDCAYLYLQEPFSRGLFLTLVLGIGSELSHEDWQVFKDTGTAHLMVVSGAHLSLFIGMIFRIVQGMGYLSPRIIEKIPLKRLSSFIGLVMGAIYAWLCGFGIPVQRAWIMAFMSHYHYWGSRQFNSWQAWIMSMGLILLMEPHALWYPGFYLSFGAVGIFIWVARSSIKQKFYKHIVSQLMCIIGLAPLSILWFQNIPLVGLFANFIAIPWLSWIILPLSLLCAITWSNWMMQLFIWINHYFHHFLALAFQLKIINLHLEWTESKLAWLLIISGVFIFVLPNLKWRIFLFGFVVVSIIPHPYQLSRGAFLADFLDVGQGLSIVIRTKNHQLIYDTGGANQYSSMAERVIIPYLHHEHMHSLDKIIVSHPDLDHRGGLPQLMQLFPNAQVIVDKPSFYHFGRSCLHMRPWIWDGIQFQFLKVNLFHASKNNHSCVLKISNASYQLLLTGDIERALETKLLDLPIQATVLQVPHHGSLTSSTLKFLQRVNPKLAVVSVGLHNRYHLPNLKIIRRYHDLDIPWSSTAELGMIRIIFDQHQWKRLEWISMQRLQFGL